MKNKIFFVLFFFFVLWTCWSFYEINQNNYSKIKEKQFQIIQHPDLLPKKEVALSTSFWFKNLRADFYWLQAIQYIGGNAVGSEYKKYLYHMLDLITELDPNFQKPYLIGQLLLPSLNQRYEDLSLESQEIHNIEGEKIWLKGIKNFCDQEKIEKIIQEDDLWKLFWNTSLRNPCRDFEIPFHQGFLYYFYFKDSLASSNYYKIASMIDGWVEWAKIMAAIMRGKSWEREKSTLMFLNLAQATKEKNPSCEIAAQALESLSFVTFQEWHTLDENVIKNMENMRKELFIFDEQAEQDLITGNTCNNYINKAIRELNLAYLDQANQTHFRENGEYANTPEQLANTGYIWFIPTDYQQYDGYGIVYRFNQDLEIFDYTMENYE